MKWELRREGQKIAIKIAVLKRWLDTGYGANLKYLYKETQISRNTIRKRLQEIMADKNHKPFREIYRIEGGNNRIHYCPTDEWKRALIADRWEAINAASQSMINLLKGGQQ